MAGTKRTASIDGSREAALIAVVYTDGPRVGRFLQMAARELGAAGRRCAGFLQFDEPRPGRSRCDMVLENLQTGRRLRISEERGPEAKGCLLDADALLQAMGEVRGALGGDVDVVLLNKFGKAEAEGQGLRPLIADAVAQGIAVVIGVPQRNLVGWRGFAGGLALELDLDAGEDQAWRALRGALGVAAGDGRPAPANADAGVSGR
ncbi:MAG: DUF2478 domain-containing protein [Hyphomicrobiaceae bacterium]|nr:DUF2478 domain-containing protein [Hyphomicrobiaceae bacterium]